MFFAKSKQKHTKKPHNNKQQSLWPFWALEILHNFHQCPDSLYDIVWQWQGALM